MSDTDTTTRVVKYRIDMTAVRREQKELMLRHVGCARQAWNWATARWLDWQRNLQDYVATTAQREAFASLPDNPSTAQIGDALIHARALMRGLGENKDWQNNAYAKARSLHGERGLFENAYTLANIYRLSAEDPESELHWWFSEGTKRPKGAPKHGVSTFAYSTALADFEKTCRAYWDRPRYSKRTGKRLGAPRFKRRRDGEGAFAIMSLTTTASGPWKVIDGKQPGHRLIFPNIGSLRMVQNTKTLRRMTARGGRATSARFIQKGDKWTVAINVAMPVDHPSVKAPAAPNRRQRAGGSVGVNVGVRSLATLSNGTKFSGRAAQLEEFLRQIAVAQRHLDRQHRAGSPECFADDGTHVKGRCRWGGSNEGDPPKSRSALTTERRIRHMHAKFAASRQGALHELSAYLVKNHALVAVEDLDVAGMTELPLPKPDPAHPGAFMHNGASTRTRMNRGLLDASVAELRRQLSYKGQWYGSKVVAVDRYTATNRTCSSCGAVKTKPVRNEHIYRCSSCGLVLDWDTNSAILIRNLGVRMVSEDAAPMASQGSPGVGVAGTSDGACTVGLAEQSQVTPESTERVTDSSSPTPAV